MYLYTKNITKPLSNASVAVDDDPEEAAGGETVGRTRRGRNKDSRPGRVSEEFATVLEEFESAVSEPAKLFEENSIYFESAEESLRTRAVFSGMLTDVVKIFETSPHSVGEGGAGLFTNTLYKTQSHPSTDKNFGNVGANVENYFLRLRDNCFLHGNRFKT